MAWCYRCGGDGRVHVPPCRVPEDPDSTCLCGFPLCPACKGASPTSAPKRRLHDTLRLLGRANAALEFPLTQEELIFVRDLVSRLAEGNQPKLDDFYRMAELSEQYSGPASRNEAIQVAVKKVLKRPVEVEPEGVGVIKRPSLRLVVGRQRITTPVDPFEVNEEMTEEARVRDPRRED